MTTRRVLRYSLLASNHVQDFPAGPVVLLAGDRNHAAGAGRMELWVEATCPSDFPDTDPLGTQQLAVFGTGAPLPPLAEHVGSVADGAFIWHVYRIPEDDPEDVAPGLLS